MAKLRFNIMPISTFSHYRVVEYREDGICLGGVGDYATYAEAQAFCAGVTDSETQDTEVTV